MTQDTRRSDILDNVDSPLGLPEDIPITRELPAFQGLLISADRALVRSFQRELEGCATCSVGLDVRSGLQDASDSSAMSYHWVAIDLDGAMPPSEAVRMVRRSWPRARVAVFSCWWSERDTVARELADVVIHKPLRAPEVLSLLRGLDEADVEDVPARSILASRVSKVPDDGAATAAIA